MQSLGKETHNHPTNSESILWGKVPKHLHTGYQGVCSGSSYAHKKKLLVSRSVGVVSTNYMVPMKILNPTPTPLSIHKGKPVGEFQILDGESQIHNTEPGNPPQVCHIIVLMPVFSQMIGLGMKKRKSHSHC